MTDEQLDLIPTDDLFAALARRWPDCIIVGQRKSGEGEYTQYRRRAGNPFTLLGLMMFEIYATQRDIQSDGHAVGDDA